MKLYPMRAEEAEIAHDLDYHEHVPSDEEEDAAFDLAAKDPSVLAKWWIACDDPEKIIPLLQLAHRAEWIGTATGDTHDKFRRELVADLIQLRLKMCREYAKENA